MKKALRKISKIVGTIALIAITIFGAVSCGVAKEDHNAVIQDNLKLVNEVAKLTTVAQTFENQAVEFSEENQALIELLESNKLTQDEELARLLEEHKLVLDEKDEEILALTAEIAEQLGTEAGHTFVSYKGLVLGETATAKTFDTYDFDYLKKGKVKLDGTSYAFREQVITNGLRVGISADDVEFEDNAYLLFENKGAVKYTFKFDDVVDYTTITDKESLLINFLGEDIEIVEMKADEFTFKTATKYTLKAGETIEVDGNLITLIGVAENSEDILVSVNQVVKAIDKGEEESFSGLEIYNKRAFLGSTVQFAEIEVGTNVLQTIEDGDEYDTNDNFIWVIDQTGNDLNSISLSYNVKANDLKDPILALGDSLDFLGYFDLAFELEASYDYLTFNVGFDEVTDDDIAVMYFDSKNNIRVGSEKLDIAYFNGTHSFYKDGKDWVISTEVIKLENDELTLNVGYVGNEVTFGDFKLLTNDFVSLGTKDTAEETDVKYKGVNIGKVDESMLFADGYVVETPEDNAEDDEFVLKIPNKEVEAVVKLIQK